MNETAIIPAYLPIPAQFKRKGFNHRLLKRSGDVALFERKHPSHQEPHWEVVIVQRHDGRTIAGKVIPPAEYYPPSEAWGTYGWTFVNLAMAEARFAAACAHKPDSGVSEPQKTN